MTSLKRCRLLLVMTLLYVSTGAAVQAAPGSEVWMTDFDAAQQRAVRLRRPLLIHFYGRNCPPCRVMDRDVLNETVVVRALETGFVAVKLDAQDPANLRASQQAHRYGIYGLPAEVIVDPLSGKILGQVNRPQDLNSYRSMLTSARTQFDRAHPVVAQPGNSGKPATPNPAGGSPGSAPVAGGGDGGAIALESPQSVIGLDGFSPVSLGASRTWVRGKPEFAFEFKGVTYHMASPEELEAFRNSPDDFAPRLLGCDPVVVHETGRAVPGRTDYGAYFDGDLYLFESDESRRRFKTNPPRYTRIQHVLRVDNIQRLAEEPSRPAVK